MPSGSQVLWFENVTEPTVLTNCVENAATTSISGNAAFNGGPFTFLGDYKWNGTLYIKLTYNGATSITKKGDWTVGNEMYLGYSGDAEPVSFVNDAGNLQYGSSSAKHELHLGYGAGTSVTVEGDSAWGKSTYYDGMKAYGLQEGLNYLVSYVTGGTTATIVGHHDSEGRGGIAAIQIVKVDALEDGDILPLKVENGSLERTSMTVALPTVGAATEGCVLTAEGKFGIMRSET